MTPGERVAYAAYAGAFRVSLPLLLPGMLVKAWRRRERAGDLPKRLGLGLGDLAAARGALWIHAVSYGEVGVARRLAAALRERGEGPVLLTSTTPTGLALARQAPAADVAAVRPFPLDLGGCQRRLFDALRPRAVISIEAELWPALARLARARGVPLAVVNGRMSDRSFRGYGRLGPLFRPVFAGLALAAVREQQDAERAVLLGARPERVLVTGDMKFDVPEPAVSAADMAVRQRIPPGSAIWVAGSTLEGEEAACLDVQRRLAAASPGHPSAPILILAPRHPPRFDRVAELVARAGLALARRSRGEAPAPGGVLLLDSLGELRDVYAVARLAFVGGSLIPAGGHNVLEPAAAGVPVLVGPHTPNFAVPVAALAAVGGLTVVPHAAELHAAVAALLADPAAAAERGAAGRRALELNRGALERTLVALAAILPKAAR